MEPLRLFTYGFLTMKFRFLRFRRVRYLTLLVIMMFLILSFFSIESLLDIEPLLFVTKPPEVQIKTEPFIVDFYEKRSSAEFEYSSPFQLPEDQQDMKHQPPPLQPIQSDHDNNEWEVVGKEQGIKLERNANTSAKHQGRTRLIVSLSGEFTNAHLGGCPDYNCRISNNGVDLAAADAVINIDNIYTVNQTQNPNQYFVFFTQESPMHSVGIQKHSGFYNLTMGYRRDADLPCPYGYTVKMKQKRRVKPISRELLKQKTKPLAWFVSNCVTPSRREEYVDALKKYLPIDIYGDCGSLRCFNDNRDCNNLLRKNYRFYLAFENSICTDYITEKLWNQGYQADVVPIVLKRSLVEPYVPPDSFLAADDFESPAKLAEHIDRLMTDDEAYIKLLTSWKQNYHVVFLDGGTHDWRERPWGFCRLCNLLWQKPRPQRISKNVWNLWIDTNTCDNELVPRLLK